MSRNLLMVERHGAEIQGNKRTDVESERETGKSRDVIAGEEQSCHEVGEEASRCLITSLRREAEEERRRHNYDQ
ncbi:hypothetical protein F2Q70_00024947 [Brassica cretica]|uniref:Uncharacterized protein n=2 Tax=Brassica cretica TaxID=69181 RepID=A0A8S9LEP2_BRACR|nr:hypothetical protein F2Q68_00024289 [Brassica cretica]KAF2604589.1 hypothetical protein F2Q70_00024947 [Brassica cretica]KAF3592609.1 hypothetical protein DY000_02022137 [Brassica cretica]